jgi:RNase P/RNase MRP subunit POP5
MSMPSDEIFIQVQELSNKVLQVLGNAETGIALNALMTAYLNAAKQRGCLDQVARACDAMASAADLLSEINQQPAHTSDAGTPPPSYLH